MARTEIPCPTCGTWADAQLDRCPNCGAARIIPQTSAPKPPTPESGLDRFFIAWANTRNPFLKGMYWVLKGIWMVYMAIVAFIIWIIAAMPG